MQEQCLFSTATSNPESIITSTTGKRGNMKSWDNRLESASIGFLGTVTVSQTFTKKNVHKRTFI